MLSGLSFCLLAEVLVNFKALKTVGNGAMRIILIFLAVILFIFVLMVSFMNDIALGFKQESTVAVGGGVI